MTIQHPAIDQIEGSRESVAVIIIIIVMVSFVVFCDMNGPPKTNDNHNTEENKLKKYKAQ